jgi:hypothetical protein
MTRPACPPCHDLGLSLHLPADHERIEKYFQVKPKVHVNSMEMADRVNKKSLQESGGALFLKSILKTFGDKHENDSTLSINCRRVCSRGIRHIGCYGECSHRYGDLPYSLDI